MICLDILISTMRGGSSELVQRLHSLPQSVGVRVVNQLPVGDDFVCSDNLSLQSYTVENMERKGLSISRNKALSLGEASILLIADDDVDFMNENLQKIPSIYDRYPDADIIVFQQRLPNGQLRKNYRKKARQLNRLSILSVSSVEISFKREAVSRAGVRFDEKFGLGARYPVCEEAIFLSDCIKAGLKIYYVPMPIVVHPEESSGVRFDLAAFFVRGAAFRRMYGFGALVLGPVFCIKQLKKITGKVSVLSSLRSFFKGYVSYGDDSIAR